MINVAVNGDLIEICNNITLFVAIQELLRKPKFNRFSNVSKNFLLFIKNGELIKYDNLDKHNIEEGDVITILAIVSGG